MSRRLCLVVSLILAAALPPAYADIRYVDDDAASGGDGQSWATAYDDFENALADARGNPAVTEIRVAGGIYVPSVQAEGGVARTESFQLINGVTILGGYRGLAGGGSEDDRNVTTWETIFSGDLDGDDGPDFANNDENSLHVFYHIDRDMDHTAVLDGCSITAGNADGNQNHDRGGGMLNHRSSPTVRHCTLRRNFAEGTGGGMFNNLGYPAVSHCTFIQNSADVSGGLGSNAGDAIMNCAFIGNHAKYVGGAIYIGTQEVINCIFSGNTAGDSGGALSCFLSSPHVINCTFTSNWAYYRGGALDFEECKPKIRNCILRGNTAPSGPQIYADELSIVLVTSSYVQGGYPGYGVFDRDPLLVDADGPDDIPGTADDDLHLQDGSPCIDAGNNLSVPAASTTDLDGNPRRMNDPETADTGVGASPFVDIGAYEVWRDCNGNQTPDPVDIQGGLSEDCDGDGVPDECEADTDGDGVIDGCDGCPNDVNKMEPGICGCGVSDVDTDGDGVADCIDQCPNDPAKVELGACGCGVADDDTDGDGIADCIDPDPNSPSVPDGNEPDNLVPPASFCGVGMSAVAGTMLTCLVLLHGRRRQLRR